MVHIVTPTIIKGSYVMINNYQDKIPVIFSADWLFAYDASTFSG